MKIIIAGGSGFLGSALTKKLLSQNHEVTWLSRHTHLQQSALVPVVTYHNISDITQCDVLINLAGAGIADKPWSEKRKQLLRDSRIATTQILVNWLQRLAKPPHTFVSGSAVGWYGAQDDKVLTEASAAVMEFQHTLCDDWEKVAAQVSDITRVLVLRTGVVLHASGGMLKRLKTPFSLGLGGKLGSGKQVLSWISLTDWLNAVCFLLECQKHAGIYNLTAPNPVSNATFTQVLAKQLHRPAFFHVPAFVLKAVLGEMSILLLGGQIVLPDRLLKAGFEFTHTHLESVLVDCL